MATSQLHEDYSREEEVKAGSDRSFGLVFAGFFAIVGALSLWRHSQTWHYTLPLAAAFLVVGLLFYVTIMPIGLVMRAMGKDFLRLKRDPNAKTYWIARTPPGPPPQSMKNQF